MKNFPADNLKAEKNSGSKGSFLAICNFVSSSSISNVVLWTFSSTGTRKDKNMYSSPAILRKTR